MNIGWEFLVIIGCGFIALLLTLYKLYSTRNKIDNANSIYCDDEVIRGGFWIIGIIFFPIGGAEIGALICWLIHIWIL